VIRNGVDTGLFHETEREETRRKFGLTGHLLASVGNLVPLKGHDLVIRALAALPDTSLIIAGGGALLGDLERLAKEVGVSERVRFLGAVPQPALPEIYSAADALVLASSHEGLPNVIMEAIACGTPVIATKVGGIPEILTSHEAGILLEERSDTAIAEAVKALWTSLPDRSVTQALAQKFQWSETTAAQLKLFRGLLARHSND